MIYVRTKDEVFILSTKHEHLAESYGALKTSKNIEDLCDEFVVLGYFAYQDLPVLIKSSNKQQEINVAKNMKNENNKVYGAIWTDKGLIYVAKMNDKGELELL